MRNCAKISGVTQVFYVLAMLPGLPAAPFFKKAAASRRNNRTHWAIALDFKLSENLLSVDFTVFGLWISVLFLCNSSILADDAKDQYVAKQGVKILKEIERRLARFSLKVR